MLNSGRGDAEDSGGFAHASQAIDHVRNGCHPAYVRYSHGTVNAVCAKVVRDGGVQQSYTKTMDDRDRISAARKAQGIKREHLAAHLGVSLDSIGRLLRKERTLTAVERDHAFKLLGISLDDAPEGRRVPIVGEIAGGDWRSAIQEALGWDWSPKGGDDTFALIVRGESMNKVARDGAVIFVDPSDRALVSGELYAVSNNDGDATFKRYRASPAQLEPMSNDPTYKPIMIGSDPFSVIGRIVAIRVEPSQLP